MKTDRGCLAINVKRSSRCPAGDIMRPVDANDNAGDGVLVSDGNISFPMSELAAALSEGFQPRARVNPYGAAADY